MHYSGDRSKESSRTVATPQLQSRPKVTQTLCSCSCMWRDVRMIHVKKHSSRHCRWRQRAAGSCPAADRSHPQRDDSYRRRAPCCSSCSTPRRRCPQRWPWKPQESHSTWFVTGEMTRPGGQHEDHVWSMVILITLNQQIDKLPITIAMTLKWQGQRSILTAVNMKLDSHNIGPQ